MEDGHEAELREHYAHGEERGRLAAGHGRLEFARTTEIILRHLPTAPALVADIGGGPGRYALWLAGLGYRVEHRDLVPLHVSQLAQDASGIAGLRTAVGDARDLDLADTSVDAVLLLGPLYHLRRRAERLRALGEARRVVRPGGPVFAAVISRWAPRMDGELLSRLYETYPNMHELVGAVERTGQLPPLIPARSAGSATGRRSCAPNCARPGSQSRTWSAWKGRRSCWPTWPSGWRIRPRGPWSWTVPWPWSGSRNCSASALTCWPPPSAPGEAYRPAYTARMDRGGRTHPAAGHG